MDEKTKLGLDDFLVESFETQTDDTVVPVAALAHPTDATRCFDCPLLRPSVAIC